MVITQPDNVYAATDMFQLDPLGILRRKFWTILFFLICSVALALLYFFKAPKTFESKAKFIVEEQQPPTMSVEGEIVNLSNVEKYLEIITSHVVLSDAMASGEFEKLESLANADDPMQYLRENLIAAPAETKAVSGAIRVRFQSEIEADCQVILANILSAFEKFVKQGVKETGGDLFTAMRLLESDRTERFSSLMKEIDHLMQEPFIQVIDGKVYNQYEGQASKLQAELDTNASERLRYVALRDNLIKARDAGQEIEDLVIDTIQDMKEGQLGGYTATHQKYLELRVREKEMMGEFGTGHPELQNLRQQIEMVDNMRKEQLLSALRTTSPTAVQGDFFSIVLNHIDNKIQFLQSHESQLAIAIKDSKLKSLEIQKDCEKLSTLLSERDSMMNNNFAMQDKLQEYGALQDFDWREVRILDPASVAEQVAPDLPISLAAGTLLGLLFGFIFAALKELAEKSFRSSDDVSKLLGVDVVAQIPRFPTRRPSGSPYPNIAGDVVTLHRPQSHQAEVLRSLRTNILFNAKQSPQLKLIQITSPSPGDGKSAISANLAVVLAQSGRQVLLIDCDLRRHTQHTRFSLKNETGLTSIIAGEAELAQAVQHTAVAQLHLLACGPACGNPSEILTTDRFAELLSAARDIYDFVVIDTPPILPVTDPAIVANFVDLILMPMRIRKGVQVRSQRAIEALALVGRNVDGVIINGLSRKEAGSYRYGGYGYSGYGNYNAYRAARPIETVSQHHEASA